MNVCLCPCPRRPIDRGTPRQLLGKGPEGVRFPVKDECMHILQDEGSNSSSRDYHRSLARVPFPYSARPSLSSSATCVWLRVAKRYFRPESLQVNCTHGPFAAL